jgi:hypothetical protein
MEGNCEVEERKRKRKEQQARYRKKLKERVGAGEKKAVEVWLKKKAWDHDRNLKKSKKIKSLFGVMSGTTYQGAITGTSGSATGTAQLQYEMGKLKALVSTQDCLIEAVERRLLDLENEVFALKSEIQVLRRGGEDRAI